MSGHSVRDHLARMAVAGVLAIGFITSPLAGAQQPAKSVSITVYSDRYLLAGRTFDDLDLLVQHSTVIHLSAVTLVVCGPDAGPSLKAAVYGFRRVPVRIAVADANEPECASGAPHATLVRERSGQPPYGIDDEAVERYWRELIP